MSKKETDTLESESYFEIEGPPIVGSERRRDERNHRQDRRTDERRIASVNEKTELLWREDWTGRIDLWTAAIHRHADEGVRR